MKSPVFIEADHSSITLGWERICDASMYELQISTDTIEWTTLSDKLTKSTIKKKNLSNNVKYYFKVRYFRDCWSDFSAISDDMSVLSLNYKQIDPPIMLTRDSISVTIQWKEIEGATGYLCRYRDDDFDKSWVYIESVIASNKMRKKNMQPNKIYYFAVKPLVNDDSYEYSLSTIGLSVSILSPFMMNLLPCSLLSKSGNVGTTDVVGSKVVGIYFSAHWCGPCRTFTPRLSQLYLQAKQLQLPFEIIFCSADHNEKDFRSYYEQSMPWFAIDFNDDKREEIMSLFKVNGIPKLSILAPSGQFIEENAVSKPLDISTINNWIKQEKL